MKLPNNRYHAFGIHLLCSIVVGLLALALVFLLWYPGLLATALDVTKIFLILLLVDICLGPLLTLVIFNLKKPELRRDLFIIFLLQVSALGYGLYTVAMARPSFILFEVDRFSITLANDLDEQKLEAAKFDQFSSLSLFGPIWAATKIPEDTEERNELTLNSLEGGDDLAQIPKYYVPYDEARTQIAEKLRPLEGLAELNPGKSAEVKELLNKYENELGNVGYLPMEGKSLDLTVIIGKDDVKPKELLNLKPW